MYKVILFDLDDTLWDFKANALVAMQCLFQHSLLSSLFPTFDSFYSVYQQVNHDLWHQYSLGEVSKEKLMLDRFLIPLSNAGCNDHAIAAKLGDDYLHLLSKQSILVDGAREVLSLLYGKYRLAIVSNGFKEVQYNKLHNSDIFHFFEKIILSDEIGYNKPNPLFFHNALNLMNVNAAEAVVVGDNYDTDIVGANDSGIDTVFFDRFLADAEFYPKSNYIIRNLSELKELFL